MKAEIEEALTTRFNMGTLYNVVLPLVQKHSTLSKHLFTLEMHLNGISPSLFTKISQAILRKAFLIQAVTVKAGSANTKARWSDILKESQRYCSFDECVEIASNLLDELAGGWLDCEQNRQTLALIEKQSIFSYEMPIDYKQRVAFGDHTTMIHRVGNLGWHSDSTLLNLVKMRQALKDSKINPSDYAFFRGRLKDKLLLLAYQTGRAQTGVFKTNREFRWEAHPRSPQFGIYSACAHIEHKLLCQICDFDGFPSETRQWLEDHGLVGELTEVYTDPITLEPYRYQAFKNDVENSAQGTGYYQLGHMVPLNSEDPDLVNFGHSPQNASWITAEGNRIQGKYPVTSIRNLLITIAKRYEEKGFISQQEPQSE